MAKFRLARGKRKAPMAPQGGLPCVILVVAGILLVMFLLYYSMSHTT